MDGGEKCFNEWAEIIQKHIETSEGFKNFAPCPIVKEFWRVP